MNSNLEKGVSLNTGFGFSRIDLIILCIRTMNQMGRTYGTLHGVVRFNQGLKSVATKCFEPNGSLGGQKSRFNNIKMAEFWIDFQL